MMLFYYIVFALYGATSGPEPRRKETHPGLPGATVQGGDALQSRSRRGPQPRACRQSPSDGLEKSGSLVRDSESDGL